MCIFWSKPLDLAKVDSMSVCVLITTVSPARTAELNRSTYRLGEVDSHWSWEPSDVGACGAARRIRLNGPAMRAFATVTVASRH